MKSSPTRLSPPPYRVSVVIPAYNEALSLGRCLAALEAQTVPADEIIVVDNNSTDETAAIARSHASVTVISETAAQGITPTRNRGLDAATGDILCRIDADTVVPPDWIAHLRRHFDAHPEHIDHTYGLAGSADFDTRKTPWLGRILGIGVLDIGFFATTKLMLGGKSTLYGSNMAITRRAWQTVRDLVATDDSVHEDIDLTACIIVAGGSIGSAKLRRVLVSSRSLAESPKKFFWRIRIWLHSAKRARTTRG